MGSRRNTDNTETALLDAARQHLLQVGWKRATLTDIARTAGVSRMTIYRRWPDMQSVLGELMTREWQRVGEETGVLVEGTGDMSERIARTVVAAARGMRANEIFQRIVEVDPEVLLTYLIDRKGRSQEMLLDLLTAAIKEGQAEGTVRRGAQARVLATSVLLATHGFAISAGTMADRASEQTLGEELRKMLQGYLAP